MKLYLVVNTKQEEDFVINICKTKDSAEKLAEEYRKNFIDTLWDCHNEH